LVQQYVHRDLGQQVVAIGGYFELVKEARVPFGGQELLYLVGHAAFETSCCGVGGCAYALVPGFVASWKGGVNDSGCAVSLVEPIRDPVTQREVRRLIESEELVHQVVFQ
jgi:hypothetical protein